MGEMRKDEEKWLKNNLNLSKTTKRRVLEKIEDDYKVWQICLEQRRLRSNVLHSVMEIIHYFYYIGFSFYIFSDLLKVENKENRKME